MTRPALPELDGEHSREWWRLMVIAMRRHPPMYRGRTHIRRRGTPPVMTPDSAWRQWRAAHNAHTRAEEILAQTRAVWLQVLLEGFAERYENAAAAGHDVTSKKALATLGLPCKDCLAPVPPNGSGHSLITGREGDAYKMWAECGRKAIDPTREEGMPQLFTLPEAATK